MTIEHVNRYIILNAKDPIDAIKIYMKMKNLINRDLLGIIGNDSTISKILNKKKKLSLKMVRNIHDYTNIPINILIQDYELK